MATIEERLKKVIVDQLEIDESEVVAEASFVDDLHADSFDLVKLLMGMEEEFQVKIKPEEMESLTTVKETPSYIEGHIRQ